MIGYAMTHAPAGTGLSLPEIEKYAAIFVQSGLFKDVRDVAKAAVKIQAGQEIGIPPFAAMRGIDIIEGKPAPNAGLTAALIRRSGRYDYRILEQTATACRIEWLDNGQVAGETGFTIEEARLAGLAGKAVWKSYASDMLFARALTRGARRFCSDVFLGSVYSAEELGGMEVLPSPDAHSEPPPVYIEAATRPVLAAVVDHEPTPELPAEPAPEDLEPEAVAHWSILIGEQEKIHGLVKVAERIVAEEDNPWRAAGALRICARAMLAKVPESIPVNAIEPLISAFTYVSLQLGDSDLCAVTKTTRDEHDTVSMDVGDMLATLADSRPPADVAEPEGGAQ